MCVIQEQEFKNISVFSLVRITQLTHFFLELKLTYCYSEAFWFQSTLLFCTKNNNNDTVNLNFLCLDHGAKVPMCGAFVFSSLGTVTTFQLACFAYLVH